MNDLIMYYHGGSKNHGCEAIVRSTKKILNQSMVLFSSSPKEDEEYGLGEVVEIIEDNSIKPKKGSLDHLISSISYKLTRSDYRFIKSSHKRLLSMAKKNDVFMSIGGDNYCYSGVDKLGFYNKMLSKKGAKTVLWGCSIEPDVLTDEVVKDLKRYDLITVRESLSYEGLCNKGIKDNVVFCSDPAFLLDKDEVTMPNGFTCENTIGINVSPLSIDCGKLVLENYIELIKYILEKTDLRITLVPHVVKTKSDDRQPLQKLYDIFNQNERIITLSDHNCQQLKGYISQCRAFIGARTHATIAAYSTCVPTLAAGYSIKAKGIAKDIFGTYENYVVPVQSFEDENCLKKAFIWLMENETEIRNTLNEVMPSYCAKSWVGGEALRGIMTNG